MVKVISIDKQCGDKIITKNFVTLNCLTVSETKFECIAPFVPIDDVIFDVATLPHIDDDINKSIEEINLSNMRPKTLNVHGYIYDNFN